MPLPDAAALPNLPLLIGGTVSLGLGVMLAVRGRHGLAASLLALLLAAGGGGAAVLAWWVGPAAAPHDTAAAKLDAGTCETLISRRMQAVSPPAQPGADAPEPPAPAIGLVSGTLGGTYHAIGQDLVTLARREGVPLFNRSSNGGLDSLAQLADRQVNAALGFAQSDLLAWLRASDQPEPRRMAGELRLIAPLFNEEIHVLARRDITRLEQLAGRRVLTAVSSHGSRHTAENLLRARGVQPGAIDSHLTFAQAACAVATGQADALVAVAGRPMMPLRALDALAPLPGNPLAHVHLVNISAHPDDEGYTAARLEPSDYPWMEQPVETLAVRALLVAMDFSGGGSPYRRMRCTQLARIGTALRGGLPALQAPPFHSKWREVEWQRPMPGWPLEKCSGGLVAAAGATPRGAHAPR